MGKGTPEEGGRKSKREGSITYKPRGRDATLKPKKQKKKKIKQKKNTPEAEGWREKLRGGNLGRAPEEATAGHKKEKERSILFCWRWGGVESGAGYLHLESKREGGRGVGLRETGGAKEVYSKLLATGETVGKTKERNAQLFKSALGFGGSKRWFITLLRRHSQHKIYWKEGQKVFGILSQSQFNRGEKEGVGIGTQKKVEFQQILIPYRLSAGRD